MQRDINGMHVILFDDILTTGQSFKQLKRRMIDLGAKSVTGIFLGKTVWLNDWESVLAFMFSDAEKWVLNNVVAEYRWNIICNF